MVLTDSASPVSGAPGAVVIYALLAVLLWPADRSVSAPFTAARAVGAPVARALWLVLWLSLAYFALLPGNRAPQALNSMIAGMESGEPGWLAAIDRNAAALVAHQGLAASIVLAVALVIIAVGVTCRPRPQGHPGPGHRGSRGDLDLRRGLRDHPHRRRHGPELRAAARPAGAHLLAGPDRGHGTGAHRPDSGWR